MHEATLHDIPVSIDTDDTEFDEDTLRASLERALALIARHRPTWIRRMQRNGNVINVRLIPGLRARLEDRSITLNPHLLATFSPAQIAASIVHEATHAHVRACGLWHLMSRAREERMCRAAECRLGRVFVEAGVEGGSMVMERALAGLRASDEDVAPLASRGRADETSTA
jgi:hypothetical protein